VAPEPAVDKELVRTCSAAEALVLAGAIGRWARVGSTQVCVREPSSANPIELNGSTRRYLVRIEVADPKSDSGSAAPDDAARVLRDLFGDYLA
jgi:hypothetical protein